MTDNKWAMVRVGNVPAPWPEPSNSNAFGFHGPAGKSAVPSNDGLSPDKAAIELVRRGVTWFTLLAEGTDLVPFAEAMIRHGIMVIVRLYLFRPHPGHLVITDLVKAYRNAGVVYFQVGNEPNLNNEWSNEYLPNLFEAVHQINDQFVKNTETINGVGGISLYPALSPGGVIDHKFMYPEILQDLKDRYGDWLREKTHGSVLQIAFSIHNRPVGHPLDYPNDPINEAEKIPLLGRKPTLDDDSCCFRLYEWLLDKMMVIWGFTLPLFATEAGYALWAREDGRYPQIDQWLHRDLNLVAENATDAYMLPKGDGIMARFKNGLWRPELRCQNFWLWRGFGHYAWSNEFWQKNSTMGDTPAFLALPAAVNFVIKNEEIQVPELPNPDLPPESPDESPESPDYQTLYMQMWADRDRLQGICKQWGEDLKAIHAALRELANKVEGSIAGIPMGGSDPKVTGQ